MHQNQLADAKAQRKPKIKKVKFVKSLNLEKGCKF